MKKGWASIALAALTALSQCGCGAEVNSPGGGQSVDQAFQRSAFLQDQKDLYDPNLKPSTVPYTVKSDFSNVINFNSLSYALDDKARKMLLDNGFVVTDGYSDEFFGLYEMNRYDNTPNFITTDAMMHTYHLFFSRLLKGVEKNHFYDGLTQLSLTMQKESLNQYEALKGTPWENAAKRNAAFFSVGLTLLQPDTEIPVPVKDLVTQELALIKAAAGIALSPLMNLGESEGALPAFKEDYSQYIPRGYYTSSDQLTRYFKTMMWYGRLNFRQDDDDHSKSALLMTEALANSTAMEHWEKIYNITSFFVGSSDDPGIYEYAPIIRQSYGGWPKTAKLPELTAQWDNFKEALSTLKPPAVNSIPIYDEAIQPDKEGSTNGFRFMGQRFTLDASIFQQLVYRQVQENSAGQRRMLPSALDVPAALGSDAALEILTQSGDADFKDYSENMSKLRSSLADAPPRLWQSSLYGGWLNTLRPLIQEKGQGYPPFMQSKAWTVKNLNTFLGSWAELKHDTVLYAKQVYAEMGGGDEEKADDRGWVEPEPMLYSRLSTLAQATADGLNSFGVLNKSDGESLSLMAELSKKLVHISEKELVDQLLDDEEYQLIRTFGGQLEHFWYEALKDEKNGEAIVGTDYPAAVISDVATNPEGTVLEAGTGRINDIYVIVNVNGSLRLAHGGVFSFYEFPQPLSHRLTDEKWRKMLGIDMDLDEQGNPVNERVSVPSPGWTSVFRTEKR